MSDWSGPSDIDPPAPTPNPGVGPSSGLISSASAPAASKVSSAWEESAAKTDESSTTDSHESSATATVALSAMEARVLGAMVEKSFVTPDVYPMTTNALVTACNQKTNRDPVVSYSAVDIDATLLELRQRNLVRRVHAQGSRSTKHRQTLDEALQVTEPQIVLLSVMMLRGPQTLNELRVRTERHNVGFDDLNVVEACLQQLASRATPLVAELPRRSGQKENRWHHLIGDPDEVQASTAPAAPAAPATSVASPPTEQSVAPAAPAQHVQSAPDSQLVERVNELETQVAILRRQLASLAEKLGEPLD